MRRRSRRSPEQTGPGLPCRRWKRVLCGLLAVRLKQAAECWSSVDQATCPNLSRLGKGLHSQNATYKNHGGMRHDCMMQAWQLRQFVVGLMTLVHPTLPRNFGHRASSSAVHESLTLLCLGVARAPRWMWRALSCFSPLFARIVARPLTRGRSAAYMLCFLQGLLGDFGPAVPSTELRTTAGRRRRILRSQAVSATYRNWRLAEVDLRLALQPAFLRRLEVLCCMRNSN